MDTNEKTKPPQIGLSELADGLDTLAWEDDKRIFHSGEVLRAGKWVVGKVCYESRPRGENNNYAAKSMLPGLKQHLDYYKTEKEAKDRVERATRSWISGLAVSINNG